MYLKDIIKIIEKKYPKKLAYSWDNNGLMLGDENTHIKKIMLTLECTKEIIDEAIEAGVDLIISHHPFIFSGIKSINTKDYKGECIYKAIKNNISIYSAHTNFDIGEDGLNDEVANLLNLEEVNILKDTDIENYFKIAVYVPKSHEDTVRNTMALYGAGNTGNYSYCTFNTQGIGTFKPLEAASPYIGNVGKLEKVEEVKIETICHKDKMDIIIREMLKVHPYEEVAYDMYKLENIGKKYGIGRIGNLQAPLSFEEFADSYKI